MSQLNILFLKNIFLKNFNQPEELMEKRMLEDLLQTNENGQNEYISRPCIVECIDDGIPGIGPMSSAAESALIESMNNTLLGNIPKTFTSVQEWPTRTNLLCWHCTLKSAAMPVSIPINMIKTSSNSFEMKMLGIFCSFPCAKSYCDIYFPRNDLSSGWADKNNFLRFLFKEFYKFEPLTILPAPVPYIMTKYCGKEGIEEDEYRKKIKEIESIIFSNIAQK